MGLSTCKHSQSWVFHRKNCCNEECFISQLRDDDDGEGSKESVNKVVVRYGRASLRKALSRREGLQIDRDKQYSFHVNCLSLLRNSIDVDFVCEADVPSSLKEKSSKLSISKLTRCRTAGVLTHCKGHKTLARLFVIGYRVAVSDGHGDCCDCGENEQDRPPHYLDDSQ